MYCTRVGVNTYYSQSQLPGTFIQGLKSQGNEDGFRSLYNWLLRFRIRAPTSGASVPWDQLPAPLGHLTHTPRVSGTRLTPLLLHLCLCPGAPSGWMVFAVTAESRVLFDSPLPSPSPLASGVALPTSSTGGRHWPSPTCPLPPGPPASCVDVSCPPSRVCSTQTQCLHFHWNRTLKQFINTQEKI